MSSRRIVCAAALGAACLAAAASARAATELVLILDNSGSMVQPVEVINEPGRSIPPADPDRLAILATLILRQLMDDDDRLTILNFQEAAPRFKVLDDAPASIREMLPDAPTLFQGAFEEARRILTRSPRSRRLLVLLTDGVSSPPENATVDDARRWLGVAAGPIGFDVLVLGMTPDAGVRARQNAFLGPLAAGSGEYVSLTEPDELVARFTEAYAKTLGSKPETGRLDPGGTYSFTVGKYVTEVMVLAASTERTGPFDATLRYDGDAVAARDQGDNGCSFRADPSLSPRLCRPPFHHYHVWKQRVDDPERTSAWSLSVDRLARSEVAYGVILRYELSAEILEAPATVRAGERLGYRARINWRGQTFADDEFFAVDGFSAGAWFAGERAPLEREPDAHFAGSAKASRLGTEPLEVRFSNRWLELSASRDVLVEGWLPLTLEVDPRPLDFGRWRGAWREREACRQVSLAGSVNADELDLEVLVRKVPDGLRLTIDGHPAANEQPLRLRRGTTELTVCAASARCCDDLDGGAGPTALVVRGADPHYHDGAAVVPVRVTVDAAGFWRCWWPLFAGIAGLVLLVLIVRGFVSPYHFEPDATVRYSRKEQAIRRARAMPLHEMPGGKRGFYRNATAGLDQAGTPLPPGKPATVRFEAQAGGEIRIHAGPLEMQNLRTRKWEAVPADDRAGARKRVLYRVGDFHFRLE